jgi:hypothetical protein
MYGGIPDTLTALPDQARVFSGWTGSAAALCGHKNPCQLTIPAGTFSFGAKFVKNRVSITVHKVGIGRVVSSPSGISCGARCSASYAVGTRVPSRDGCDAHSLDGRVRKHPLDLCFRGEAGRDGNRETRQVAGPREQPWLKDVVTIATGREGFEPSTLGLK